MFLGVFGRLVRHSSMRHSSVMHSLILLLSCLSLAKHEVSLGNAVAHLWEPKLLVKLV